MRLLLVDATNLIMRAAFGGDIAPADAFPIADGLLRRAVRECQATHAVLAFDYTDAPTWRRERFEGYKAGRREKGGPGAGEYIALAGGTWARDGWSTLIARGFEADDIIATLVHRLAQAGRLGAGVDVVILSGDSDLQALVTDPAVAVLRPQNGGEFELMRAADVCAKHSIATPAQLTELKALAGEPGDSIPGPYGKHCVSTARKLLEAHGSFAAALREAKTMTPERRQVAELALELVQLRTDVPLPALAPKTCGLPPQQRRAA